MSCTAELTGHPLVILFILRVIYLIHKEIRKMDRRIRELINAKKDSDRANKRLRAAKEAVEKAYPQGVSTSEVLVSFIDEHTTSSYNWKKLEKAMEVDPVLEAIGKMFIETTPVKVSYRYKFY